MKAKLFGFLCALSLYLSQPHAAEAQNCGTIFAQSFSRLRTLGPRATDQGRADAETRQMSGPRQDLCETGAYQSFLESLVSYSREALRAPKKDRDNLIRLAIAAVQQAPMKVPYAERKTAPRLLSQARSDLSATVEDVGETPLMRQLLSALITVGPPAAGPAPPSGDPDPNVTTTTVPAPTNTPPTQTSPTPTTTTSTPSTSTEQKIKIPNKAMPGWAIIKIYQMRDALKQQDTAALQIRLQDVINWIESNPPD